MHLLTKPKLLILRILVLAALSLCFSSPQIANAITSHSGGTDSSGCHTCRTNCPKYGLYYGQYHCHNPKSTTRIPASGYNSFCVSDSDSLLSYSDIRLIQAALTVYGFPPGPVDGYLGRRTQLAINVFEFTKGLSLSSDGINFSTVRQLGILC